MFIERGLDPDFIDQIEAKIVELSAASTIKNGGLSKRIGGTAALGDLARRGMEYLRELDAILTHKYRNDAGLRAAWKGAVRVRQESKVTVDETAVPVIQAGSIRALPRYWEMPVGRAMTYIWAAVPRCSNPANYKAESMFAMCRENWHY